MTTPTFRTEKIDTWSAFVSLVAARTREWIFRGQPKDDPLSSSLERAMLDWKIAFSEAPGIERQLIREFRRRIPDPVYQRIHTDTLYCMALMRHYGAPARLLDCTYSPFVAAKFALERGGRDAVIYCFNGRWIENNFVRLFGSLAAEREADSARNDKTFRPLYFAKVASKRTKFIHHENPLYLNERLTIQQGVFLCPGDVTAPFLANIQSMKGWQSQSNVVKVQLTLRPPELIEFAGKLKTMNLSSSALFPGPGGFASSMWEHMLHFQQLAKLNAGRPDS